MDAQVALTVPTILVRLIGAGISFVRTSFGRIQIPSRATVAATLAI